MSGERWSRALMEVGGGLEKMVERTDEMDREKAADMRELSMQKLRGKQGKEVAEIRATAVTDSATANRDARAKEGELNRQNRTDTADMTMKYQEKRLNQQRIKEVDALGAASLKTIDMQISELNVMLSKAQLESVAGVDESAVKGVIAQRETLLFNRINQSYRNIAQLKALGDDRYKDMDEEKMAIEAGYSPQQIADAKKQMEDASGGDKGVKAPPPVEVPPAQNAAPARQLMPEQQPAEEPVDDRPFTERVLGIGPPLKNEDGSMKYPGDPDAPIYRFGRWLDQPANEVLK